MLFKPKHQKLILQCYPAGRGSDKKPNSSELSYLLFYASTRRVKLEKVGRFLQKKNAVDISRARTGNVQVTLEIIDSLIKKCPDDVNVFANNVNAILLSVLATNDLSLCQHAASVYHTLCQTLDGELFNGDFEFNESFVKVTTAFIDLGFKKQAANSEKWKAISFTAAESFASSKFIAMGKGKSMTNHAIGLVLDEVHNDYTAEELLKRTNSRSSSQHELSRLNTTRTARLEEPETPLETRTDELAKSALKSFFYTSSGTQIAVSTRSLAEYLTTADVSPQWSAAILEMATRWIPVQLRFLVLSIILSQLQKTTGEKQQVALLGVMSSLLSSSVNLVGLSVIDHLRQLVGLQVQAAQSGKVSETQAKGFVNVIGSLATHIYYQDQIIDMVGELSVSLKDYYKKSSAHEILVLLDDIKNVLIIANQQSTVQRANVPLEIFYETFNLLAFQGGQSKDLDFAVQRSYTELLVTLLQLEYAQPGEFVVADYDNLISNAQSSVINQLYEAIERWCVSPTQANTPLLLKLIDLVVEKFGINAMVNAVPFFLQWQLQAPTGDVSATLKDNLGLYIIYSAAKTLQLQGFREKALACVNFRREHNMWIVPDEQQSENSNLQPEFNLSREVLESAMTESLFDGFRETMFTTHYRYRDILKPMEPMADEADTTIQSHNGSHNISLSMLVQPQQYSSESGSVRSAPMSARSLIMGKLNVPKVQELRQAISGSSLAPRTNGYSGAGSKRRTDVSTLLSDLEFQSGLDDRGALTR